MKLQIIGFSMLLLGISFSFTSCQEEIDANSYNVALPELLPTFAISSDSLSYDRVWLDTQIEINGDEEILECGYMACVDKNFPDSMLITKQVVHSNYDMSAWIDMLLGNTEYFYKAYTYSKNGFSFSEVGSITTTDPPVFEDTYLFGTFNQIDYSIKSGVTNGDSASYWKEFGPMTIKQVEGTYNQIAIYNYWGYGRTIVAVVNFKDKTLEVSPQEIAEWDENGPQKIYQWSMDENSNILIHLEEKVHGHYDEHGNITLLMWGSFAYNEGYYVYDLCTETHLIKKDPEEEEEDNTKSISGKKRAVVTYGFNLPVQLK